MKQNNNFARARLQRENASLHVWSVEDVNMRRRIFLSLSKLECGPQEINSREIRVHLTINFLASRGLSRRGKNERKETETSASRETINARNFEKTRIHF